MEQEGSNESGEWESGVEDASFFAGQMQQPLQQPVTAAAAAAPPPAPGTAVGVAGPWRNVRESRAAALAARQAEAGDAARLADARQLLASYLSESPDWEPVEGRLAERPSATGLPVQGGKDNSIVACLKACLPE